MSTATVRERVRRARDAFARLDGAVLTTVSLDASFLEDSALPAVLAVDADTPAARDAALHERLGEVPLTVFYDPSARPRPSGRFRYQLRPVPLRGRFFHPKVVALAGRGHDGHAWVYLAVGSANLTLSGWGRNAEGWAETWIHTQAQQPWQALRAFLAWLTRHASLGERPDPSDATRQMLRLLDRMPDRRRFPDDADQPWGGSLYVRFYASVVHTDGLAAFLREGRRRPPRKLWASAPFWGDLPARVQAFGAHSTTLVPALLPRGEAMVGISREEKATLPPSVTLVRNEQDQGAPFWHLKAIWLRLGDRTVTALGSCNFTPAGLVGGQGNVECMLAYDDPGDWLPGGQPLDPAHLAAEATREEDAPEPAPVAVVVAWDWRDRAWRWWLEPGRGQAAFQLACPGLPPLPIGGGTGSQPGQPPPRRARYTLRYTEGGEPREWSAPVVELNLDHSTRTYGRPLTAGEILDEWRGRPPGWDLGGGGGGGAGEGEGGPEAPATAAFDAVNLYDLYRAFRSLGRALGAERDAEVLRGRLVGHPTSVFALAALARQDATATPVRYLVLREAAALLRAHTDALEPDLPARVEAWLAQVRAEVATSLSSELAAAGAAQVSPEAVLEWFEARLAAGDPP